VAYGAKVGSNHTGRVADQEAVVGEGVFFGLGAVVKFPINLQDSPYTLVAADTTLERQRCGTLTWPSAKPTHLSLTQPPQ
jgi:hypothetical protein